MAAIWNQVFPARQEAYFTLKTFPSGADEIELVLHNQNVVSECESIVATYTTASGPPAIKVAYCTGGIWTDVGVSVPMTLVAGDQLWARSYGNGVFEVYVNGSKVGTWDVSAAPMNNKTGRIGLFVWNTPDVVEFDSFGGGTF